MHYYKFNVGDYRRDTSHLTLLEHGAYRQLLDTYYLNEAPIKNDEQAIMRTHCARNADEMQAIKNVLKDFFELIDGHWHHRGCEKVLGEIYAKSGKARSSALKRWHKNQEVTQSNANALQTQSDGNATTMLPINPLTHNSREQQHPKPSEKRSKGTRLSKDWQPTEKMVEFCRAERPDLNPIEVSDRFRDYWIAQAGSKGVKLDWDATWRNWVRNERTVAKQIGSSIDLLSRVAV